MQLNRNSVTGEAHPAFQTAGVVHHNMKRTLLSTIAIATLATPFLLAQSTGTGTGTGTTGTTPTPPTAAQIVANRVTRLTALLTLTSTQQTQATTIFTAEQTALSTIMTSLQTAHTALQTAIKADDQTGIGTQSTQIGSLTTQQIEAQAKGDAAFYALLTSDQKTKYDTLQSVGIGGGGGGGRGPGGPGGPGGFGGPGL